MSFEKRSRALSGTLLKITSPVARSGSTRASGDHAGAGIDLRNDAIRATLCIDLRGRRGMRIIRSRGMAFAHRHALLHVIRDHGDGLVAARREAAALVRELRERYRLVGNLIRADRHVARPSPFAIVRTVEVIEPSDSMLPEYIQAYRAPAGSLRHHWVGRRGRPAGVGFSVVRRNLSRPDWRVLVGRVEKLVARNPQEHVELFPRSCSGSSCADPATRMLTAVAIDRRAGAFTSLPTSGPLA